VLWEAEDDAVLRFRCRVGHAYGAESLLEAEAEVVEEALWTALRALQEQGHLARRVARRLRAHNLPERAERYERQAVESEQHVSVLREVLLGHHGGEEGE
jgi:two-component system chemotaxis response regulator CheB